MTWTTSATWAECSIEINGRREPQGVPACGAERDPESADEEHAYVEAVATVVTTEFFCAKSPTRELDVAAPSNTFDVSTNSN